MQRFEADDFEAWTACYSLYNRLGYRFEYLGYFEEFISSPNMHYEGTLPVEKRDDYEYEFEFRNVSFKYPGTEQYVLRNVNLKFDVKKRFAIVGQNGAGKTTIIKLLCRLYEPTAALDPIAEAEIYENFNNMIHDKTVIFISHRMSSCKFCDEIIVFEHGEIVQRGAHAKLAEAEGLYQQLWNAQAQYYKG